MVAAVSETRLEDLPPLTNAINPDALETLLIRTDTGWLTFEYAGYRVRVTVDRTVTIHER